MRPLRIGQPAQMKEQVLRRSDKQGRSGHFHVVTAEYQYFQDGALCVREERDIVYLQGRFPPSLPGRMNSGSRPRLRTLGH